MNCGKTRFFMYGLTAVACLASTLQAATITVDTLVDENDGVGTGGISLRDAINEANSNGQDDTIDFSVTGTITLTADLPSITTNVIISGPGVASLTIDGDDQFRAFVIKGSSTVVSISEMKISSARAKGGNGGATVSGGGGGGAAGMGAAIYVNDGDVLIDSVAFEDNQALGGNGGTTSGSFGSGGGGGGVGGNGNLSTGGGGGFLGGSAGTVAFPGGNGGEGAGAGGGGLAVGNGGNGGFGGGGGGGGLGNAMGSPSGGTGGAGGFGGGGGGAGKNSGGGGSPSGGSGGTHGGDGGTGSNGSQGFGGGGAGLGGAIFVRAGALELIDCTFDRNAATGGTSGGGDATVGEGKGGAIYVNAGATVVESNTTHGTGGDANSASDDSASAGDDDDVFGTVAAAPTVQSMTRQNANPSNASQVTYFVTFSEAMTGVNAADFTVVATGVIGATIDGTVTDVGGGAIYAVTINTGSGSGTVALKLADDDTIANGSSAKLGGTGTGNGDFTASEVFTLDRTKPAVSSIVPGTNGPTNADTLTFAVTFDGAVSDFDDVADVEIEHDGTSHKGLMITSQSDTEYTVTVSGITGDGEMTMYVKANAARDAVGNKNAIAGPSDGVMLDNTSPVVDAISVPESVDGQGRLVFPVQFSESVTGLASDDITINHDGTAHDSISIESEDADTYRVVVGGVTGTGSVTMTLRADAVTDAAGNGNAVATSAAVTIGDDGDDGDTDNGNGPSVTTDACGAAPFPVLAFTATLMTLRRRRRGR